MYEGPLRPQAFGPQNPDWHKTSNPERPRIMPPVVPDAQGPDLEAIRWLAKLDELPDPRLNEFSRIIRAIEPPSADICRLCRLAIELYSS